MGSWRKVGAFLGLVPEQGPRDEFGDEYHDGEGYRDDYADRDSRSADDADDDYADDARDGYQSGPRPMLSGYQDDQVAHGSSAIQHRQDQRRDVEPTGAIRPVTVKLTGFSEARVIGEKYREGKPVILDMTEMDDAGARRLVDFAAGLAFALRGSIDKVTTKVFMLLPPDTDMADIPQYETSHAGYSGGFGEPSGRERQAYAGARAGR